MIAPPASNYAYLGVLLATLLGRTQCLFYKASATETLSFSGKVLAGQSNTTETWSASHIAGKQETGRRFTSSATFLAMRSRTPCQYKGSFCHGCICSSVAWSQVAKTIVLLILH